LDEVDIGDGDVGLGDGDIAAVGSGHGYLDGGRAHGDMDGDGIVMEIDLVATVVAPRWIANISPPCNDNGSKPSLCYSPPIFHCEPFECSEIRGVRFGT
jgi:hypothetical protein